MWQLDIGSNTVSNCNVILRIDGVEQVVLERGDDDLQLLLTADIYDETGKHIAKLRRNAWTFKNDADLDLATSPSHLVLSNRRSGEIVLQVEVLDRDHLRVPAARLYGPRGTLVVVTEDAITLPGDNVLSGNSINGASAAISVNSPRPTPGPASH